MSKDIEKYIIYLYVKGYTMTEIVNEVVKSFKYGLTIDDVRRILDSTEG